MKKLILASLILVSTSLSAQQEATTRDGKKVILNENGTWIYKPVEKVSTSNLDCSDLIITQTDKMTGKSSVVSSETLIISDDDGKTGFGVGFLDVSGTVVFSILTVGAGSCIDDSDKMNVLFRDGTRLELTNNGGFNCDSKFTLYFGTSFGKKKELQIFKTKEIESMRIWTSKSYVEKDFSNAQSKRFMKTVNCLTSSK